MSNKAKMNKIFDEHRTMKETNKIFIEPSEKNPTKIVRDFFMQSGEKYVGRIVRINCLKKVQRFYLTSGMTNGKIPMRIFPSLLLFGCTKCKFN